MLEIGVATGAPLKSINSELKHVQITAIDIDEDYIKKAKEVLAKEDNIQVKLMDFYKSPELGLTFDTLLFGSSFMLMPDQKKALDVARSICVPGSKVYFLLTLYPSGTKLAKLETIKPMLKKYTSVDFGKLIYENDFERTLIENKMRIIKKERITSNINIFLKVFRFFCVECEFI